MSQHNNAALQPGAAAVRQLWAEALARRAAAQPEPVRRRLAVRLATLEQGAADVAALPVPDASPPELQALQRFRATWSRLAAEERVQQALAHVPPQAGPLNSSHLVYRALLLMRETAPEYLQRFVPYVDALLWLEHMQAPSVPPAAAARRKPRAKAAKPRPT